MMNQLKIIQINVNSLVGVEKRHEMSNLLIEHDPDLVLLCETKLNNQKIQFKNYKFIRSDRKSGHGGGTGILIRDSIKHERISPLPNINSFEHTMINVILKNGEKILISSVYVTPTNNELNTSEIDKLIGISQNNKFIIGGDFNARHSLWKNLNENKNGKLLFEWYLNTSSPVVLKSSLLPSRISSSSESFIDLFLMDASINILYENGFSNYLKTEPYDSDHMALKLNISFNSETTLEKPFEIMNLSNVDWKIVRQSIDSKLNNLALPVDVNISASAIDEIVEETSKIVNDTLTENVPLITLRKESQNPLPGNILSLIKYKNMLRRILFRNRTSSDFQLIKSLIKCIKIMIRNSLRMHYNNYYSKKLSELKIDNNIFKNIKRFCAYKARESFPDIVSDMDGSKYCNLQDKANALAKQFASVHLKNIQIGDELYSKHINQLINNTFNRPKYLIDFSLQNSAINPSVPEGHLDSRAILSFTCPDQIRQIVKFKNNKKSAGVDGTSNFILKKMSNRFFEFVSILFNHIFNSGHWPKLWKEAIIIPLLKPGKAPENISSYRPISLLSCLSKVYETVLHRKISLHCDINNIISKNQFGFRANHSTNQALAIFQHDITQSLNLKQALIGVSLDCEKAFDTMWIEGLIYKMKFEYRFHDHICRVIFNFLKDRKFSVKLENIFSCSQTINSGVPQGSILAPLLFILFISDIPDCLIGNSFRMNKILYADDILVYTTGRTISTMQTKTNEYLKTLFNYTRKWKIALNPSKSEAIVFRGKYNTLSRKTLK